MNRILPVEKAKEYVVNFKNSRVLVVGDVMLDHFIWGKVERISPEAPVPVVEVTSDSMMLGGSANVASNVSSLGGKVYLAGVIGKDSAGREVEKLLKAHSIDYSALIRKNDRPTSVKTRIVAHNQQVVRFDRESLDSIDKDVIGELLEGIKGCIDNVDVVVISDYAKGVVGKEMVGEVVRLSQASGKMIIVDPKVKHFYLYNGITLITPNTFEASKTSGVDIRDEESLKEAGKILLERSDSKAILITRGEHGMTLFERDGNITHIPTVAKEVYDVTGAGDTVVAAFALSLASGAAFREAAVIANYAAGIVVGEVGTATVSFRRLMDTLKNGRIVRS